MAALQNIGSTERVYPVYKIAPLIAHLRAAGIADQLALAGAGMTLDDVRDPYFCISRRQVATVFDNFLRLAPPSTSPLQLGAAFQLTDFGFFGYGLLSSVDVRQAIAFGMAYRELATPIVDVEFDESGDQAAWIIRALPDFGLSRAMQRFVEEYQSGILLAVHKNVTGDAFQLCSARFAFAAPATLAPFQGLLNCPVEFAAARTELRFDKAWLERKPIGAHAVTFQLVTDACHELSDRIDTRRGMVGEIYRQLLAQSGQFPSLEAMATRLHVHPRTLRRKIISEGTTYQKIIDEVRFRLASTYLTRTRMNHDAIAERLGLSDASSFRRAFKRWAQLPPTEFKKRV